jgi:hypothetical protein
MIVDNFFFCSADLKGILLCLIDTELSNIVITSNVEVIRTRDLSLSRDITRIVFETFRKLSEIGSVAFFDCEFLKTLTRTFQKSTEIIGDECLCGAPTQCQSREKNHPD